MRHCVLYLHGYGPPNGQEKEEHPEERALTEMRDKMQERVGQLSQSRTVRIEDVVTNNAPESSIGEYGSTETRGSTEGLLPIVLDGIDYKWQDIQTLVWWKRSFHQIEAFLYWIRPGKGFSCWNYYSKWFLATPDQAFYFFWSVAMFLLYAYSLVVLLLIAVGQFWETSFPSTDADKFRGDDLRRLGERLGSWIPYAVEKILTGTLFPLEYWLNLVYGTFAFMNNIYGCQGRTLARVRKPITEALRDEKNYTVTLVCHSWGVVVGVGALNRILKDNIKDDMILAQQKLRLVTLGGCLNGLGRREEFVQDWQRMVQDWVRQCTAEQWKPEATRWLDACADDDYLCAQTEWLPDGYEDDGSLQFESYHPNISRTFADKLSGMSHESYFSNYEVARYLTDDIVTKTNEQEAV